MLSKNLSTFISICALLSVAIVIGRFRNNPRMSPSSDHAMGVPCLGRVQVLNGSGTAGAADKVANFLRSKEFDVKEIANAASWNYPFTLVVSRTKNMVIAQQIAKCLSTDRCILVRNEDSTFDATVIAGPDYRERIR